jgi:hypothetical protein
MNRMYSIALHDVRVSDGEHAVHTMKQVMGLYGVPLTVHLVFDRYLENNTTLSNFIIENVENGTLEIVFHGLTHQCSRMVAKTLSFYHKYQAEYLDDSDLLRENTKEVFINSKILLGQNIGICPPCWIAIKRNIQYFQSLSPLFIENILTISFGDTKLFSPVISLGSTDRNELFLLKFIAKLMYLMSLAKRNTRLRIAVHLCDLERPTSLEFLSNIIKKLNDHKFLRVFLKEMK